MVTEESEKESACEIESEPEAPEESYRARRARAFLDFMAMEGKGSLNALYNRYRQDPDNAPTLSKSALSRWAKQGNWKYKRNMKARDIATVEGLRTAIERKEKDPEVLPEDIIYDKERQELVMQGYGFAGNDEAKKIRMGRNAEAAMVIDKIINDGARRLQQNPEIVANDAYFFEKIFPQAVRLRAVVNKEDRIERGEAGDRVALDLTVKDILGALPESVRAMVEKRLADQGKALPSGVVEGQFREVEKDDD